MRKRSIAPFFYTPCYPDLKSKRTICKHLCSYDTMINFVINTENMI